MLTHAAPPPPRKASDDIGLAPLRAPTRSTVIPIPELPIQDQTRPLRLEPVVRSRAIAAPAEARAQAPRRFPRGTEGPAPSRPAALAPSPALREPRPANDAALPRDSKRIASH
jgi:hypothetical protein